MQVQVLQGAHLFIGGVMFNTVHLITQLLQTLSSNVIYVIVTTIKYQVLEAELPCPRQLGKGLFKLSLFKTSR